MQQSRIVTLRFGTGRQKMALERWTNPTLSRRTCTCEYGLQFGGGKSAGFAKQPRELFSHPKSLPGAGVGGSALLRRIQNIDRVLPEPVVRVGRVHTRGQR